MTVERGPDGKFVAGNCAAKGNNGGRPRAEDAARLSAAMSQILDDPATLERWMRAMRRKLAKGDLATTQFVFDRLAGKVPDKQEVSGPDGETLEIVIRHVRVPYPDAAGSDAGPADGR